MAIAHRSLTLPAFAVALVLDGLRRGSGPVAVAEIGAAFALVTALALAMFQAPADAKPQRRRDAMTTTTPPERPDRMRPPVIFGASPTLLRIFQPEDLPALARGLPEVRLPRPLRLLSRDVRDNRTLDHTGLSVLLEHDVADLAAAVVVEIARTAGVPLLWVSARELVSSELAFPQRAMSGIVRFAVRNSPCLVYVHGFDAIAHPSATYPSHYARRATHDVVSAMRLPDARNSDVLLITSASPGTLDSSVVIDRFDVAIRLGDGTTPELDVWVGELPDAA